MTLVLALLGCCLAGGPAVPSNDGVSTAMEEAVAQAQESVAREAASLGATHPWAGTYRFALTTLAVAPIAGFAYESTGCFHDDRNAGSVVDEGARLRLHPTYDDDGKLPVEWLKVAWGAPRYLVKVGEIQKFCNAVNRGEPMHFLLRDGDGKASGLPQTIDGPLDCVLERAR